MKKFKYTAVDYEGRSQQGILSATSTEQAVDILRDKSLIATSVEEQKSLDVGEYFSSLKGVSEIGRIVFTRQLAVMLDAGIPIIKSLRTLQEQVRDPILAETIGEVAEEVDGGSSLHKAMSRHPDVFDNLYLSLIDAGERSGNLVEVLNRLSETQQRSHDFKGKVKGAMIYPAVILTVMIGVVILMVVFVIPRLKTLYDELEADLPITTKIILGLSSLVVSYWWMFLLTLAVAVLGLRRYLKTESGKILFSKLQLKLPVFGLLTKQVQLTSFCRTLGMLISSGLPIIKSLEVSSQTMSNMVFRQGISDAMKALERGEGFGVVLSRNQSYPSMFSETIKVGEATGKLDQVLRELSQYFEGESLRTVENLSSLLEPIVIVILGIGIGFLIISLILPIYSLTSQF